MLKMDSTLGRVLRVRVVYPIISSRTLPTRMKHLKKMPGDTRCLRKLLNDVLRKQPLTFGREPLVITSVAAAPRLGVGRRLVRLHAKVLEGSVCCPC